MYQLLLDDAEVGSVEYDPVGELSILIKHTEVTDHNPSGALVHGTRVCRNRLHGFGQGSAESLRIS